MATETRAKQDVQGSQRRERGLQRQPGQQYGLSRWEPSDFWSSSPFALMRQMQDEISRFFDRPLAGRDWQNRGMARLGEWAPAIDVFQRGDDFVIRADVPGMSRDDITVEVGEDAVTLRGERKYEHEEESEGLFRSERSYGSFARVVALPEGAIPDTAKATFKNGVLEIVVSAPPSEVRRGRRLDIKEEQETKK